MKGVWRSQRGQAGGGARGGGLEAEPEGRAGGRARGGWAGESHNQKNQ